MLGPDIHMLCLGEGTIISAFFLMNQGQHPRSKVENFLGHHLAIILWNLLFQRFVPFKQVCYTSETTMNNAWGFSNYNKILQPTCMWFIFVLNSQHPCLNNMNILKKKISQNYYSQIMAQEVCDGVLTYLTTNEIYEKLLRILHEIFYSKLKQEILLGKVPSKYIQMLWL